MKHGYDRANTGLIAEAAGVSIGSVYQYYPNKEAVFSALLERELEALGRNSMAAIADIPRAPVEEKISALVHALCATKARNPKLSRVLKTELGRLDGARIIRDVSRRNLDMTAGLLAAHSAELPVADTKRAAFFVVNALEGILGAALHEDTGSINDPAFPHELTCIVLAMLRALQGAAP